MALWAACVVALGAVLLGASAYAGQADVRRIAPVAYSGSLELRVPWPAPLYCSLWFSATAKESARAVTVSDVRVEIPQDPPGGDCAGVETVSGQAVVPVALSCPVAGRAVVTRTGVALPRA